MQNFYAKIMAQISNEISRTFNEYLLIPGLTTKEHTPDKVRFDAPLVRFKKGETSRISLKVPFVSAIMQSVSGSGLAISLAKEGGLAFIYGSQSIENQAKMVAAVKHHKSGFVESSANLTPEHTMSDVIALKAKTGFSNIGITDDGSSNGILLGVVTSRDYRPSKGNHDKKIKDFMTPREKLITATEGVTLGEANDVIWENKLNSLPIVDAEGRLRYFVFRKDYASHKKHPNELLDSGKSLVVGAGINTRDYEDRIPALVKAGVDVLCIDSSDGFSEWQKETIAYSKAKYGDDVLIGAGNVVDKDGFLYLAEAGADFIKVGVGGGSICITREQKGIGRGQATSIIDVAQARDEYFEKTGVYIPICSDGGIVQDYHMTLALAMGADFLMMGRYFARFDESPTRKVLVSGSYMKEYWGEGSNRARNWQRYDMGGQSNLKFEEGVDSYVPYAGKLKDNLDLTVGKIKATMCSCGVASLAELQKNAKITLVSATSIVEGGAHDVIVKDAKN